MTTQNNSYVNARVLKLNVGFLLTAGPGHNHDSEIDFPGVMVSDDLKIEYLRGTLRLSRTKEGILVQATLQTAVQDHCVRCLDPVTNVIDFTVEELFSTYPLPEAEFVVDEDAILDLGPLLRAEVLIEESHQVLCSADCKGLCPECGANLNHEACSCTHDPVDPRLAVLKNLLDSS